MTLPTDTNNRRRPADDRHFLELLAAAQQLSVERALVFTYDRDGWRVHPAALYDPFDGAPLATVADLIPTAKPPTSPAPAPRPSKPRRRRRRRPFIPRVPLDQLKPCGTHAAYNRHKARGEQIDDVCRSAERTYQSEKYQRQVARSRRTPPVYLSPQMSTPLLTTRDERPLLVSVAGQRESALGDTSEPTSESPAETVAYGAESEAS